MVKRGIKNDKITCYMVIEKKYLVRLHARERMLERNILLLEIRECMENVRLSKNFAQIAFTDFLLGYLLQYLL